MIKFGPHVPKALLFMKIILILVGAKICNTKDHLELKLNLNQMPLNFKPLCLIVLH